MAYSVLNWLCNILTKKCMSQKIICQNENLYFSKTTLVVHYLRKPRNLKGTSE